MFHALIGLMFGFYSGVWETVTFGTIFEIVVYIYGLSLATFYITVFWKYIKESTGNKGTQKICFNRK